MGGEAAIVQTSVFVLSPDLVCQGESPRPHILWKFHEPYQTLSWALVGGGWRMAPAIAWLQVDNKDLGPDVCAQTFLRQGLDQLQSPAAVGLMTSARVALYQKTRVDVGAMRATVVATVGLGNALRAGDPTESERRLGTINIACSVDHNLSFEAALEALTIVTEAKAAALADRRIVSKISGLPATGTGTDCHVLAFLPRGELHVYAGKHTALGRAIGTAVYETVLRGIDEWRRRHPHHPVLGEH